jgi:PAS domain S-box-containing protein
MSTQPKAAQDSTQQSKRIAELEQEVAGLRQQLALVTKAAQDSTQQSKRIAELEQEVAGLRQQLALATKAAQDSTQQSKRIAELEQEAAGLRQQLALVTAPSADHLTISPSPGQDLLQSEAYYRALIEFSPQVVWMTDTKGANIYCNRYWHEFSGMTLEQSLGSGWTKAIHPEDVDQAVKAWREAIARGVGLGIEVRFRRASDGEYRWHLVRGVPIQDTEGKIVKRLGVAIDIHERRTAADAINEADLRRTLAAEAAKAGTWDYYPKTGELVCSPRTLAIFRASQGVGATLRSWSQSIHNHDRQRVQAAWGRAMDPAVAIDDYDTDYRIVWPGGAVRWIFAKGKCSFSGEGPTREAVRLSGIVVDVTERYEVERDRAALIAAWQNSPDFVGLANMKFETLFVNVAGLKMMGLSDIAEAKTKDAKDYLYPEEQSLLDNEILPLVRSGKVWEGEFRMRNFVTGEPIPMETRVIGVYDEAGELTSVVNLSRDISERKKLEERLRLAQKMEAVGRLAATIAHDFNNDLAIISGAAEALQRRWAHNEVDGEVLKQISDAVGRASKLTRKLLTFSRPEELYPRPIDLNRVVRGMQYMLQHLGEDLRLEIEPGENLDPVKMDPNQMDRILINLATNARDAMPRGGVVRIRTFSRDAAPASSYTSTVNARGYACLSFSDNGCGMDQETLSHIFEPFFTTKERGTGLGLYTVYLIATQNGGDITVESSPGHGTTFTLYLPCTTEAVALDENVPEGGSLTGSGSILLVEDQDALRGIIVRSLREDGYLVQEAADAEKALQIAHFYDFDLLLADVILPKMNGPELAEQLVSMQPKLKVIFLTGDPKHQASAELLRQPNTVLFNKPFRLVDLAAKIEEVLNGPRSG